MTTASDVSHVAWLAQVKRAAAMSEDALPTWESLDAAAQERLAADADIAIRCGSSGEYFDQWRASRTDDGWTYGAALDFTAKTSPMVVEPSTLTDEQWSRITLWHSVCRACWRSLA